MSSLKYNLSNLQEKAKERTVKTQNIEYDLETMVKKIDRGIIKLDPEYQRRHRWDDKTSSRLIESLILNIPIPTIYISQDVDVDTETEEYRYSVIDGQQRLTAIHRFFKNKFTLIGLDILEELEGCYHKDLPPFLIRRLEERTIKCLRIDSTIDAQVKLDIFERLNSGSVKLEPQELRNAVFSGSFNLLCKELSKNLDFRALLQIDDDAPESNTRVKKMEDVEIVLRFFSFINNRYLEYKKTKDKGLADFLSETMKLYRSISNEEIAVLRERFIHTMFIIRRDFGNNAFAKYKYENGALKLQSKFNVAVYDALVTTCHDLIFEHSFTSFIQKVDIFKNLFKDTSFYESVSANSADTNKLKYRIERAKEALA